MNATSTKLTADDLRLLPRAQRIALWSWLDVHPYTPVEQVADKLNADGFTHETLAFALTLLGEPEPVLTTPLAQSKHPLCDLYDSADLKLLARKLEIPHAYRSDDQIARDIEAMALKHDWTLETLNLLLHTRKMPRLIKKEDIMG